ncbi:MAG: hypothetical protein AAGC64_13540 [Bacteroidota bacterium]
MRRSKLYWLMIIATIASCGDGDGYSEYYDSGVLKIKGSYSEGVKNGDWFHFKENKDTLRVIRYAKGDTVMLKNFFNGDLLSITEYQNNARVRERTFFPNGRMQSSYDLNGGVPTDTYEEFYENGQLRLKTDNYGEGLHLFYDSLGVEYEIYFKGFERIDSLTRKTGNQLSKCH